MLFSGFTSLAISRCRADIRLITRNGNNIDRKIPYQALSAEALTIRSIINRAYEDKPPKEAKTLGLNLAKQMMIKSESSRKLSEIL